MRVTKGQLRRIIRESVLEEAVLDKVKKWINDFPAKAKDFFQNLKQEAEETAMVGMNIGRMMQGQSLPSIELEFMKNQIADIGKGTVIGAAAAAPGGSLLVPFLLKAADKMGVDLVPSAFKDKKVLGEVHIREYIRRILLESEIHPKIEAQLEKALKMGLKFNMLNWGGGSGGNASISISIDDSDGNTVGRLQAYYDKPRTGPCNGAAVISGQGVKASHGLGPLLYDLAFEIAEKKGLQGLGPDPREVSDEAAAVWDYYLNNRPDIEARQRDFKEDPQTPPPDDDCLGQEDLAKKFGGTEKAYSSSKHIEPIGFDDPEEGYTVPTGYTPEFIEHYFDPKNALSKTYHKTSSGTPILDYLSKMAKLPPAASRDLGMPQSEEQIVKYLEDNPKKWPLKSYGGKNQNRPENRLPLEDVIKKWQGDSTP